MNRRTILSTALSAVACTALPAFASNALPGIDVFKSPSCECCSAWVDHMKANGFDVKVNVVNDTTAVRKRYGMPDRFGSCHTATVSGYVIEGHVPAAEVKRLLASRAQATGLSVPGMVPGSPGMEVGTRRDPYQVFLIGKDGRESVYSSYPKA